MPPYRRRYRYNFYRKRRRPWLYRRRTRKTFRRKWRRPIYRRRYKVKRRRFYRKKKKIVLSQFQPTTINKCKIIGYKCLLQGSPLNSSKNYIQYVYSMVPPHWPGGGGWSLIIFSLASLYEDYLHLQNIWTRSNAALPLVRYRGCRIKFFQSEDTDYIVTYDRCWPMVDTMFTHADAAPSRMLQKKHKITVPSRRTSQRKKPYKAVFIKPPAQMTNEWYFQRDLCKIPLLMITTTAIDLTHPFCSPKAKSNNITIRCLSPLIFQNIDFANYPKISGYWPKKDHEGNKLYLYASHQHFTTLNQQNAKNLIPLLNTKDYQPGSTYGSSGFEDNEKYWGNPFYYAYITDTTSEDTYYIYISKTNSATMKEYISNSTTTPTITLVSGPFIYECRYNPERDTGAKNKCYLVSTSSQDGLVPPQNTNFIFDGFPLYILLWSWTDWIKKLKQTPDIDKYQLLVIETDQFDVTLPQYIPIDIDFTSGFDPYTPDHTDTQVPHRPNIYNSKNWHPKLMFQQQMIEKICQSGPGCCRSTNYFQAHCKYKFFFNWGGCPKQLQKAYDPCLQSKYTTANNIGTRLEITNPNRPPQSELYYWDWEKDYVKEQAIQRIGYYTETDVQNISVSGNANNPPPLKKVQEKEDTAEKEEKELFLQLQQLRHRRLLLELHCKQLLAQ
nr:MAG: ORF1 [TTV-like mini virus]